VGYLHDWTDNSSGNFLYYSENSAKAQYLAADPLSGIAVDGTKTIHAAGVYQPDV